MPADAIAIFGNPCLGIHHWLLHVSEYNAFRQTHQSNGPFHRKFAIHSNISHLQDTKLHSLSSLVSQDSFANVLGSISFTHAFVE